MGLFDRFKQPDVDRDPVAAEREALGLIDQGNALEDQGSPAQALAKYDEAIRLAPTLPRAHLNRGNILLKTGNADAALDAYSTAVAHDPEFANGHYSVGNVYLQTDRLDAALLAYTRAVELDPDFVDAQLARNHVIGRLGKANDATAASALMWLHIGGKEPKPGWKILNAMNFEGVDFSGDVRDLSRFPDGCCEKVYASHVMEHIGQRDFATTLTGINRILCKGGEFYFSAPDLETLCRLFLNPELGPAERFHVMRMMFGGQIDDYDFHYIGLTNEFMLDFLRQSGFSSARRVESFGLFDDTSDYKPYGVPISLNLIAIK
jgi:predicted SAM-dependent methyltransferase